MSENLPTMISRAAQALAKATTAGEVLEARKLAIVAYDAAKLKARLTEAKEAHAEILATCRQTMADALMIEARAQCRIADEYDAAQQRGEVQKAGGDRTSIVPNKNNAPRVTDIGLTRKQVHEARIVRDAEKKKPGTVQKAIDKQLKANREPTRADVKRAVKETASKDKLEAKIEPVKRSELDDRNAKIISLADHGWSAEQIAREFDLVTRVINRILEVEKARRFGGGEPTVEISMTAKQKLETAIRQAKRSLEAEFDVRIRNEVRKRLEETILPHYKESYAIHQKLIKLRKGVMDKSQYRKFLFCLHPDRVANLKDEILTKRFDDALGAFIKLEKILLNEKESPTEFPPMPSTYDELMKARQKVMEKRRAKYAAAKNAPARR